jgi:serine/threonine protein kinase
MIKTNMAVSLYKS